MYIVTCPEKPCIDENRYFNAGSQEGPVVQICFVEGRLQSSMLLTQSKSTYFELQQKQIDTNKIVRI